ncbi:MAG: DUF362 domain-containing protein [Bacteroidetes bacterium]|nr:DUF362 domain-containing protein [Bacteroidota bacterium]
MTGIVITKRDLRNALPHAIRDALPEGNFRRVFLKPNWVKHQEHDAFPISALVTDSALIEGTIDACVEKYRNAESIIVGDVPLQSCDFELLKKQSGVNRLIEKYRTRRKPSVHFLDLRRERWRVVEGFMQLESDVAGDPLGYVEVTLNEQSMLEEVSHNAANFRVSDYDPKETTSVHRKGMHSYVIARSVLNADLFINMPKMKTHQKGGITGALKNLVGINGSKAHLVHHQRGTPKQGGDEFSDDVDRMFIWQARLKEKTQKRSKALFIPLKAGWEAVKRAKGISTTGTRENLTGNFYVGAGSWHGNDSIWRMVYDLNMILPYASEEGGILRSQRQRECLSIADGIIAGEGNGPLQPLPVETGIVAISKNPFLIDFAMAKMMGFDFRKIRMLANYKRFPATELVDFEPASFATEIDGVRVCSGVDAIPVLHPFIPPPGWKGRIELESAGVMQ